MTWEARVRTLGDESNEHPCEIIKVLDENLICALVPVFGFVMICPSKNTQWALPTDGRRKEYDFHLPLRYEEGEYKVEILRKEDRITVIFKEIQTKEEPS